MNEKQANAVADALGGNAWQSGGDIWVVIVPGEEGRTIMIDDNAVCEYEGDDPTPGNAKQLKVIKFAQPSLSHIDKYGRLYILGLPVEPDMPTLKELIGDENDE